jgi:hypothetical protein
MQRLTKKQVLLLNRTVDGTWVQTSQGINVEGNINLKHIKFRNLNITALPVIFNVINGHFDCSYNKLTTLQGTPTTINGNFYCSWNKLTTLQGTPTTINGDFYCSWNKLTNLHGAPKQVNGDFNCDPKHHQEPQYKLWQLKQKLMQNHPQQSCAANQTCYKKVATKNNHNTN